MSWQGLFLLYVGICAGWGVKEGWDQGGLSDAIGNGFLHGVASPIVPFTLVGHLWEQRQRRRSERDQLYAAYGGHQAYRRQLRRRQ